MNSLRVDRIIQWLCKNKIVLSWNQLPTYNTKSIATFRVICWKLYLALFVNFMWIYNYMIWNTIYRDRFRWLWFLKLLTHGISLSRHLVQVSWKSFSIVKTKLSFRNLWDQKSYNKESDTTKHDYASINYYIIIHCQIGHVNKMLSFSENSNIQKIQKCFTFLTVYTSEVNVLAIACRSVIRWYANSIILTRVLVLASIDGSRSDTL